jgi:hypothetical protein
MKTTMIILAALLTMQVNMLFAHNDGAILNSKNAVSTSSVSFLIPVTPKEASFDEAVNTPEKLTSEAEGSEFTYMAPTTPSEASFEEDVPQMNDNPSLAPVTPREAGFEE